MSDKKLPTPEEIWDKGWDEENLTPIQIMQKYGRLLIPYVLQQAAEKAKIKHDYYNTDDFGSQKVYDIERSHPLAFRRTDQDGDMYAVDTIEINKESILSLEEQIIKDLKL